VLTKFVGVDNTFGLKAGWAGHSAGLAI
jgi:hypothetical protein